MEEIGTLCVDMEHRQIFHSWKDIQFLSLVEDINVWKNLLFYSQDFNIFDGATKTTTTKLPQHTFSYLYTTIFPSQWVRSLDLTTHTSLSPIRRGLAPSFVNYKKGCTRLAAASDKVYQLLAHGRWFSPGTPASSTTKTGRHDIAEILLKVALLWKKRTFSFMSAKPLKWGYSIIVTELIIDVDRKTVTQIFYSGQPSLSGEYKLST